MVIDEKKIEKALDGCLSRRAGQNGDYEHGVIDALRWVLGLKSDEYFDFS